MPLKTRLLSILLALLALALGAGSSRAEELAEPQLGATFLNLYPGMQGELALAWHDDPAARADVYLDFDGDGGWTSDELVLEQASLAEPLTMHKIKIPAGARIDLTTRARFVVQSAGRGPLLDIDRPLYEPRTATTELAAGCAWKPGFGSAPVGLPITAMAIYDDGAGAALYVAVKEEITDPETNITSITTYLLKWNGSAWQTIGPAIANTVQVLTAAQGYLYAGGDFYIEGAGYYLARWNGSAWQNVGGSLNGPAYAIAEFQNRLYVGGAFTQIGSLSARYVARWDGQQWNNLHNGANNAVYALEVWNGNLYAGGAFTTMDGFAASYIARYDGNTWSKVAAGSATGLANQVYDLETFGPGANTSLYAGGLTGLFGSGATATSLARWDGSAWSSTGVINGTILALESFADLEGSTALYAGGAFSSAGGIAATYLARWTGSQWQSLGTSTNGAVRELVAGNDVVPVLWTSGDFGVAPDGTQAYYLARYDGIGFTNLGAGLDDKVLALRPEGLDLLAGGAFVSAGGVTVNRVGGWDGRRWSKMGIGSSSVVYDLEKWNDGSGSTHFAAAEKEILKWNASSSSWSRIATVSWWQGPARSLTFWNGQLYAASEGDLLHPSWPLSLTNYSKLARWNGTSWEAVPGAPTGALYALTVGADNNLYVGGSFSEAGGAPAMNIARYNGTSWSAVGAGLNSTVMALTVHLGKLHAGGKFTRTADSSTILSYLAKWDGANWEAVGGGTNHHVNTLASLEIEVGNPRLVVGGRFSRAGTLNAVRLAAWDEGLQRWEAFGSGLSGGDVYTLAQIDGTERTLYVGGSFLAAGGIPSYRMARWVCPGAGSIDVAVSKTSSPQAVEAGLPHGYTVRVENLGSATARDVVVEDAFSAAKLQDCSWNATPSGNPLPTGQSTGSGQTLRQTLLTLPPATSVDYAIVCTVRSDARGSLINTATVTVTGDSNSSNNQSSVTDAIIPPLTPRGDCNESTSADAADRQAIHLEIFDGDGSNPAAVIGGTHLGHPTGCNANEDDVVDAGDLACLDRLLVNPEAICDSVTNGGVPVLTLPTSLVVVNRQTFATLSLDAASHELHSLSFSVDYDPALVTPAASLESSIEKPGLAAGGLLLVQHNSAAHRVDLTISQPPGTYFGSGALIRIPFEVAPSYPSGSLRQKIVPTPGSASFGDLEGNSISGYFILSQDVVRTLILTDTGRLGGIPGLGFEDPEPRAELIARLRLLANHDRIHGLVVDLASYQQQLAPLYEAWNPGGNEPRQANEVLLGSGGLLDILADLVAAFPGIESLLIVGDDRIVPMARLRDGTELREKRYTGSDPLAQITTATTVGQSLQAGYFLSDDPLASVDRNAFDKVVHDPWRILLPRLAPGRLVETADEIFRALDRFQELDGVIDLGSLEPTQRQVLVTGYDFLRDGARQIGKSWGATLAGPLPPAPRQPVDTFLVGNDWQKAQLFDALSNRDGWGRPLVIAINGHANHHQIGVPTANSGNAGLGTSEIYGASCATGQTGSSLDLAGAAVIGMSCHGGLAVPGSCATDADRSLDLPEVFLASGALAYGDNSGFGWGTSAGWGLGERLAVTLHEQLQHGGTVGAAVREAKLRYYLDSYWLDAYDRKSLMQWTLYGFPMAVLSRLGQSAAAAPGSAGEPTFGTADADGFRRAEVGGVLIDRRLSNEAPALATPLPDHLTRAEVRLDFTAPGVYRKYNQDNEEVSSEESCLAGCYYRLNGLASDESDLPIQPYFTYQSSLSNTLPRQSLWLGGEYRIEEGWQPLMSHLRSVVDPALVDPISLPRTIFIQPRGDGGGEPLPGGPGLGCLEPIYGVPSSEGRLSIMTGVLLRQPTAPATWQERIFEKVNFEAFYFGADPLDCEAPQLDSTSDQSFVEAGRLQWRIAASDGANPVWRVVVVWDNEEARRYEPVELFLEDGFWRGSIEVGNRTAISYFVQAADREGNVSWMIEELDLPASGVPLEVAASRQITIDPISADLGLEVTLPHSRLDAGEDFKLIAAVTNAGPDAAPAKVELSLPEGFSHRFAGGTDWICSPAGGTVTCSHPSVAAGALTEIFFNLRAPAEGRPAPYPLCAALLGDPGGPADNNACGEVRVIDASMTDLRITGALAISGNQATFSFDVYNADHDVSGALLELTLDPSLSGVSWTCTAPPGAVCQPGNLGPGQIVIQDVLSLGAGQRVSYHGTATFNPLPSSAGPMSIRGRVELPAGSGMIDYLPDNNQVQATSEAWLFADGFESGDLSGWSLQQP